MEELGAITVAFGTAVALAFALGLAFLAVVMPWFVYQIHVNTKAALVEAKTQNALLRRVWKGEGGKSADTVYGIPHPKAPSQESIQRPSPYDASRRHDIG